MEPLDASTQIMIQDLLTTEPKCPSRFTLERKPSSEGRHRAESDTVERGAGIAQWVECLPSVHEALGSIPITGQTWCDCTCNPSTHEASAEVQGLPQLHGVSQAIQNDPSQPGLHETQSIISVKKKKK